MAMSELGLIFLGTIAAVLSGAGLFARFSDNATNVVMAFAGAITWGGFAISSFDVIIHATETTTVSEPMLPLAYLGFAFAMIVAVFAIKDLFDVLKDETDGTTEEQIMP